ncbi:MAG TPA: acyl-CoA dehydrogenase family protein [Hyphomicrobiaceae bacterium]|nr:acyl-CoA dehydrogenase family protein [Hyphomicrobiaceae bacterium]
MNFEIDADIARLASEVRAFVASDVIPLETDPRWGSHGPSEALRRELTGRAKRAGLLGVNAPVEYGGRGLDHRAQAVVFEAAGYSMLGPAALQIQAPDEGNINLLSKIATPAQKEKYLRALATGETRSCFAMTEPSPGAGSDPGLLTTRATPKGNGWVINGRKWLITGAEGASVAIIMARTGDGPGDATMFLAPLPHPAFKLSRVLDTMDSSFMGGHAVIDIENLEVSGDDVLGEVGQGFRYAQVRLAPARLTHCMRWLGSAQRAHDIATAYARERTAFGKPLGAHEGVSFMLADNELDMHTARLAIWHCAWILDTGGKGQTESSMAKVIASEAIFRVADRCVQILGGLGITRDTVVERIFRDVRAFRIYDGPSEVHRWSLGRRIVGKLPNAKG